MLNQKAVNILFLSFFVFGLFMFIKEKREVPVNYEEDIIKSLEMTKRHVVPNLKQVFGESSIEYGTKGVRNNLKHSMKYALVFPAPNEMQLKKEILKSQGWVEYTKEYQKQNVATFCKNKLQLILTSEGQSVYAEIIYDRLSPCWKLNEELQNNTFSLVE